jgi:hypothetical protein
MKIVTKVIINYIKPFMLDIIDCLEEIEALVKPFRIIPTSYLKSTGKR